MATFTYRAKAHSGEVVSGRIEADDHGALLGTLRGKGLYPMQVSEVKDFSAVLPSLFETKVTTKDLAIFCRQFQTMISSGIVIVEALFMLKRQTKNPALADALNEMYEEVQKGRMLSEAMAQFPDIFPRMMVGMIDVGEISGTLDAILERLTVYLDKENKISGKVKTAMVYPTVISGIALIVIAFLMIFVVPQFMKMFTHFGTELPLPTRILIATVGVVTNVKIMIPVLIVIAGVVLWLRHYGSTGPGKEMRDRFVLKLPVIGNYVYKVLAYRLTRSLGELLHAGVPLLKSLEIASKVMDNAVISSVMDTIKQKVSMGVSLADAVAESEMFPVMVSQMIRVGEKAGTLDAMMVKVADYFDEELDTTMSRMVTLIEPLMLLVMALVVGFIVISMVMPIFSVYSNIG